MPTRLVAGISVACGGGSVVERHLAKVDVASSSLVPRSILSSRLIRAALTSEDSIKASDKVNEDMGQYVLYPFFLKFM